MAFDETAIFPTDISRGARPAAWHRHDVQETRSGAIASISPWPNHLWKLDVAFGLRSHRKIEDVRAVYNFFQARDGISRGFRVLNPFANTTASDHVSAATKTDEVIGTGDGSTTRFQLVKTITQGGQTKTYTIRKPISGTVLVDLDGTLQTETTHYAVDYSTGEIEMVTAPTGGGSPQVLSAGCQYHLPMQFAPEMQELAIEMGQGNLVASTRGIHLVEMPGDTTTPAQYPFGGSAENGYQSFGATTLFDWAWGRCPVINPTVNNVNLVLPHVDDLLDGHVLTLINNSGSNAFRCLNRATGSTEFTVAASGRVELYKATVSGTAAWFAVS